MCVCVCVCVCTYLNGGVCVCAHVQLMHGQQQPGRRRYQRPLPCVNAIHPGRRPHDGDALALTYLQQHMTHRAFEHSFAYRGMMNDKLAQTPGKSVRVGVGG